MSVLSDSEINGRCMGATPMISPFIGKSVKTKYTEKGTQKILSYGLSSYGYDIRLAREELKVFTNLHSTIVDPRKVDPQCYTTPEIRWDEDGLEYVLQPPNSLMLGHTIEWFNIPRDILATCLGKSTYARCFTGDTKIALVNGTSLSFKEMMKGAENGERYWGYGVSDSGDVVVVELKDPRLIARSETIYEVTLDNGEVISCTGDHQFLLLNGDYVCAADLKEGISLFPLYRSVSRGYEAVMQPSTFTMTSTHWLADDWNVRHGAYSRGSLKVHRHHKDHDRRNNKPTNIERLCAKEHLRHHTEILKADSEHWKRQSEKLKLVFKERMEDPEWKAAFHAKCRDAATGFWHDDKYAELRARWLEHNRRRRANMTPEERKHLRDVQRKLMLDPARREAVAKTMRKLWESEEFVKSAKERARKINIRSEIGENEVIDALEKAGSIRGAARLLDCDKTVFRRFPEIIQEYKNKWANRITKDDVVAAFKVAGGFTRTARLLSVSRNWLSKRMDWLVDVIGSPVAENHKVVSVERTERVEDVYCLSSPETGNFALEAGVFVKNCGVSLIVTPLEPEWSGNLVVEIVNHTNSPVKIYPGQGIGQLMFHKASSVCLVSYGDRGGKYQGQSGTTDAKV